MSKKETATNQPKKKFYKKPWFWILIIILAIGITQFHSDTTNQNDHLTNDIPEVEHRSGEDIVGISDKDISEINISFVGNVRNDVTGNWRYSTTIEDIDIENYALSYYNKYFENDDEIHGIINFTRNTTACLNISGDMIFLSLHNYVDGEEQDAKQMFSGTTLAKYIIYKDNGDIQKLGEDEED